MIAGVLLLASCGGPANEESRSPVPAQRTAAANDQRLEAALDAADLALQERDHAMGGGVYTAIDAAGRGVDIATTLEPTPGGVDRAVDLCTTAAAVVRGYRVSVDARNGRLLAFKIHDRCQRVHLKATTTLWTVL